MKAFKACTSVVALLALLALGGCATMTPESSVLGFQNVSSLKTSKVILSVPEVVERDMETKKTPDAVEKTVAEEVYANLKENLVHKELLYPEKTKDSNTNIEPRTIQLRTYYINIHTRSGVREYMEYVNGYSGISTWNRSGGQMLAVRAILREKNRDIVQIDTFHNIGTIFDRKRLVQKVSAELANQIEKILNDGVTVGKSP